MVNPVFMSVPASITARSHRQAMDWSLALISQGIESTILEPGDELSWRLEVAEEDYTRAVQTIRQYRLENTRWGWRRQVPVAGYLFDWGSLGWGLLIGMFYWMTSQKGGLKQLGVMDVSAITQGEWWRMFTAVWLHADVAHLAGNASIGIVLLGLVMGAYGTGTGLLAAYLGGVGGNLLVWLVAPAPRMSLGASGLVMACVGLLSAQAHTAWHAGPKRLRYLLLGGAGGLMLFVLLGLGEGTDVLAHFGGFLFGLMLGGLIRLIRLKPESGIQNVLAGVIFALLTLGPWALAILRLSR